MKESFPRSSATASITAQNFNLSISGGSAQLNSTTPKSLTISGTTYLLEMDLSEALVMAVRASNAQNE